MSNATNTAEMLAEANAVLDTIKRGGLQAIAEHHEGWRMKAAGYAGHELGYAGHGSELAEWEVIIEHASGVSVILRNYVSGKRIARFAIGSDENASRNRAAAELCNYYCRRA